MALPAVLPNPTPSDRFAHLQDRLEPEGKRWARRRENAKFAHNPHIALPTSIDDAHPPQLPLSTFPHPLPAYLPRTVLVPPARPPPTPLTASSAGLFSLSLRGARRALRARPSSAFLVKAVETHLAAWLEGGTYLNPDRAKGLLHFPGDPVGGREDIREVGREAGRLVWIVKPDPALQSVGYGDGGFERYVVHCVARWYGVVSFSKETEGRRLTYLLRPNLTRPGPTASASSRTLDTPPTTDASDFNATDVSDSNPTDGSDSDSVAGDLPALSNIEESRPSSPDSWSAFVIDSDNYADDHGFAASMESLSLSAHADVNDVAPQLAGSTPIPSRLRNVAFTTRTALADVGLEEQPGRTASRARADRVCLSRLHPRSASSPSPTGRTSHRLPTTRRLGAKRGRKAKNDKRGLAGAVGAGKGLFYDYLFA